MRYCDCARYQEDGCGYGLGHAEFATAEVNKSGVFTLPGLCRIKTRKKPATKAGKREVFGKLVVVKAKPACTIATAFPWLRSRRNSGAGKTEACVGDPCGF